MDPQDPNEQRRFLDEQAKDRRNAELEEENRKLREQLANATKKTSKSSTPADDGHVYPKVETLPSTGYIIGMSMEALEGLAYTINVAYSGHNAPTLRNAITQQIAIMTAFEKDRSKPPPRHMRVDKKGRESYMAAVEVVNAQWIDKKPKRDSTTSSNASTPRDKPPGTPRGAVVEGGLSARDKERGIESLADKMTTESVEHHLSDLATADRVAKGKAKDAAAVPVPAPAVPIAPPKEEDYETPKKEKKGKK